MNEKQIEKWIKDKNKDDIKHKLNPIYSIKIGSPYESREMYEDIEQIMVAVANTFYKFGLNDGAKKECGV